MGWNARRYPMMRFRYGHPALERPSGSVITKWFVVALALIAASCSDGTPGLRDTDTQGLSIAVAKALSDGTRPSPANFTLLVERSESLADLQVGECQSVEGEPIRYFIRPDKSTLFFEYPTGQNTPRWADCPPEGGCERGAGSGKLLEHLLSKGGGLQSINKPRQKSGRGSSPAVGLLLVYELVVCRR